jgi:GTPase SAR1 family protein
MILIEFLEIKWNNFYFGNQGIVIYLSVTSFMPLLCLNPYSLKPKATIGLNIVGSQGKLGFQMSKNLDTAAAYNCKELKILSCCFLLYREMLSNSLVQGKPLLLLCNKTDLDPSQVNTIFNLTGF